MARSLLTKGAVFIAAVLSLYSCESHDILVVKEIELKDRIEPLNWTCKVNQTLQIIFPSYYEDNIEWSFNIRIANQCELKFEKPYFSTSHGKCLGNVTFTLPNRTYVIACNRHNIRSPIYIAAAESSMKVTVQSGQRDRTATSFIWWLIRKLFTSSESSQSGFSLTLRGVPLSQSTSTPTIADGSVDTELSQPLGNEDDPKRNVDWQGSTENASGDPQLLCSVLKKIGAKDNFPETVSVNCSSYFPQTTKDVENNFQGILDQFKTNGSQCEAWCGIIVQFATNRSILYLNDTHALTEHGGRSVILSCTPNSGTWSNLASCQGVNIISSGFTNITSTTADRKAEGHSVIWIGLGSAASLLVVIVALVLISLVVRGRFPSAFVRCSSCCVDVRSNVSIKPKEQIAMEDNPIYG